MDDIAAMLTSSADFAKMDAPTRTMMQHVLASIPVPAVSTASPISAAAVAGDLDGLDHISHLPSTILRNILSRLPIKDAARTTVLFHRWRHVWHSVPLFLVDAHLHPSADIAAAVSSALSAHPGPFDFLHLSGTRMNARPAEVLSWFDLLASKGVKNLAFMNRGRTLDDYACLPSTLFRCTSLLRLYIGFWKFPDTTTLPPAMVFHHLRELGLCSILIDERDLSFILEKCPVLSKFIVVGSVCAVPIRFRSRSLRCVQVCTSIVPEITAGHAPNLERLLLWEAWGIGPFNSMESVVKIGHSPILRIVGFLVPGMHQLQIGNTVIKARTRASPETTVPSVLMLAIQVKFGAQSQSMMVPTFLKCFPNIETLYVQCERDESSMNRPSKLNIKFWEDVGPIECLRQHVKKIVVRGVHGKRSKLAFLKFVGEHAHVLEKLVIVMAAGYTPTDQVGEKLMNFLASLKWANQSCRVSVSQGSNAHQRTPWCYLRAFDLANQDPFDVSSCARGKCVRH